MEMALFWDSSRPRQTQPLAMLHMELSCCAWAASHFHQGLSHLHTHTHTQAQSFHSHTQADPILSCWLSVLPSHYGPLSTWASLSVLAWQPGSSLLLSASSIDKPGWASVLKMHPMVITKSLGGHWRGDAHMSTMFNQLSEEEPCSRTESDDLGA